MALSDGANAAAATMPVEVAPSEQEGYADCIPRWGNRGWNVKERIPHKENKGITVVAKPATKVLVFLLAVLVMTLVMVIVNHVMAGV